MAAKALGARDARSIPAAPGTYVLVLVADTRRSILVGRRGRMVALPGYYAYVGSALGPGGLRARIARHLRKNKKRRWHVDYLRAHMRVIEIWYATGTQRRECEWADRLQRMGGEILLRKLGASDCRCAAHLFRFEARPGHVRFARFDASPRQELYCLTPAGATRLM